ncbi:hypothetical protein BDW75DRAFT_240645 [Aspergillus navahoensis]
MRRQGRLRQQLQACSQGQNKNSRTKSGANRLSSIMIPPKIYLAVERYVELDSRCPCPPSSAFGSESADNDSGCAYWRTSSGALRRGISRSGAVVVAYIMRTLVLPYRTALNTAQLSRPQILPNMGFEWQLRVWEGCGYDVFDRVPVDDQGQIMIKRKASYEHWVDVMDKIYDRADAMDMARAEDYLRNLAEMLRVLR